MQTQLIQRIMRLAQRLHLLIPSIRSSALHPVEEASTGEARGNRGGNEASAGEGPVERAVGTYWCSCRGSREGRCLGRGWGEWAVVDEEGLAQITQILAEQQAGLQHLTKILQKDLRDLNVVFGKSSANMTLEEGAGSVQESGDNSWGSTSTLRASALK
jgi:nuclear pore complex protein Nup54